MVLRHAAPAVRGLAPGAPQPRPSVSAARTAHGPSSSDSTLPPTQDLLKHTPPSHPDHPLLQDALRISQNFLSSINEEITPRRQSMTVKKGEVSAVATAPVGDAGPPVSPQLSTAEMTLAGWTPVGRRGVQVGLQGCGGLAAEPPTLLPDRGPRYGPEGRRHLSAW